MEYEYYIPYMDLYISFKGFITSLLSILDSMSQL